MKRMQMLYAMSITPIGHECTLGWVIFSECKNTVCGSCKLRENKTKLTFFKLFKIKPPTVCTIVHTVVIKNKLHFRKCLNNALN